MSRDGRKILVYTAISLVACVLLLGFVAIRIAQTGWFRNYVREKAVAAIQEATGGKVEIGSFRFDWKRFRADFTDLVIRGDEPPGTKPFLFVPRIQVGLRLFASLHHIVDVSYLGINRPETNILVLADGHTNIPVPKPSGTSRKQPLHSIVDAAIGRFDLNDASLLLADRKQVFSLHAAGFHARLAFNTLRQEYRGELSFRPVYLIADRNTPVAFTVSLPITIASDRLSLEGATVTTANSNLRIDGSLTDMRAPSISAHVTGSIATVDLRSAGNLPVQVHAGGPRAVVVDAEATLSSDVINVSRLWLVAGQSSLVASGPLKEPDDHSPMQFTLQLVLGEIGHLIGGSAHVAGTVTLNGTARVMTRNDYGIDGYLNAEDVSVQQGDRRSPNVDLSAAMHVGPNISTLHQLRVDALGAELTGDASLRNFAQYLFDGTLHDLTLRNAADALGERRFPYSGIISGPVEASGDFKDWHTLTARIGWRVTPEKDGIPVSGRLFAEYRKSSDELAIEHSYLALPHSRLRASGSAGRRLNLSVTTTDPEDFLAASPYRGISPVRLGHPAEFTGVVTGGITSGRLAGHLRATSFSVEGRRFDSLNLDTTVTRYEASISQGSLIRGAMQTRFSGHLGMSDWKVTPGQSVGLNAEVNKGDLADLLALAGQPMDDTSGPLTAKVQVNGTVGNPAGSVDLASMNGVLHGEPFDRIQAHVNLTDQLISISSATAERGSSRVAVTAELHHPRDSFTRGQLRAQVSGTQIELAQIRALQKQQNDAAGRLDFNVEISADLATSNAQLTGVNGTVAAHGLRWMEENAGDLNITARSSRQTVQYQALSTFGGANIRVSGQSQLQPDYRTVLDARISDLPIEQAFAAARRTDVPAKGRLSGTLHFDGTKSDPEGSADLSLANAVLYDEPVTSLRAKAILEARRATLEQLELAANGARLKLSAQFDHPQGNWEAGTLEFHVTNGELALARLHKVQTWRPGLGGTLRMSADGSARVNSTKPYVALRDLKASVAAIGITAQGKNLGDAAMSADTRNNRLDLVLTSNLAGADIRGYASAQLGADYPVDAQLNFSNLAWNRLRDLIPSQDFGQQQFDAAADGRISVQAPLMKPEELSGSVRLNKLELSSASLSKSAPRQIALKNPEPIAATLDKGTVRIESAHLTGPQSDIQMKGSFSFTGRAMNLTLNANANLGLIQTLDHNISSSGTLVIDAAVHGTVSKPAVNGMMQLRNVSFNYSQFPNGISNGNGTVDFSGNLLSVRNLTAESGGGKLALSGLMSLSDDNRVGLRASATGVRVQVQEGVSAVANGNLELSGTRAASTLSGRAIITKIIYAPKTDLGSILTRTAPQVESISTPSPLLENMKLDVQLQTSDALAVQSSLAQSLEGTANLRVGGTASHPSVLGRVTMTSGTLTFFGSSYTMNSGTISFYNPVRIEPVLDVSLETNTKGVDVTLHVTGPIDNLKLSYTSDPPLQFEEIIGLLASGKTPTSDPTLLANYPPQQQTVAEMGESALLGQALVNPVANSLQRVFGVTQLKIDPAFTSGSSIPQSELSLQQQIASNITFTYITQVNNANAETIRVEVTLNPRWSAAAMRDENGIFSINLFYKRQFR